VKILIVGATSGLGRDVVAEALAAAQQVAAVVRNPARAASLEAVEVVQRRVPDPSSLAEAVPDRC
jgi:uncharacterized protein YbjT (DUF2867 family)